MPMDARNQAQQYISLAESQNDRGQFHDALTSLNLAGELAHKAQAVDILSNVYGTLGIVYHSADMYDDALNNYTIALQMLEELAKHNPVFNVWVATTLNNLGNLLADMGCKEEAKARYERALKMREKLLEADYANVSYQLDVAGTLYNLGTMLAKMGRIEEAKAEYEGALKMYENLLETDCANVTYQSNVTMTLNNLGTMLADMGRIEEAKELYEGALKMYENLLEIDRANVTYQSNVAMTLNNLGTMLADMGRIEEAKARYERALKIREKLFEADCANVSYQSNAAATIELIRAGYHVVSVNVSYQSDVADTLNNLGALLANMMGRLNEGKERYERAIKMYENLLETDRVNVSYQPKVAATLNNLGALLADMGRIEEAKAQYERALKMREKLLEEDQANFSYQSNVAMTLNNLANLLTKMGQFDEAKAQFEGALKMREKLLEADRANVTYQSNVAMTLNNLANLLTEMGQFYEAKERYEGALKIYESLLETDCINVSYQSNVAMTLNGFGTLLANMGRINEAKARYEGALKMYEKLLEADRANVSYQSNVAHTLNNFANLLANMGRIDEAKARYEMALKMRAKLLEADRSNVIYQSNVALTLNNLAALLANMMGYINEAKVRYEMALKMRENLLEADLSNVTYQSNVADTLNNLGALLADMGRIDEAKVQYEMALKMRENLLATDPANVSYQSYAAGTLNNLGLLLADMGRIEDAKARYEGALKMYENLLATDGANVSYQSYVATTLNNLGNLLANMGRIEEAKARYEGALKMREKSLGIFTEPMQYLTIRAKSRTLISIIQLYFKNAEVEKNKARKQEIYKSVSDFYQFHMAFFSEFNLDHEGRIAKEAGLGAHIYYLMLIARNAPNADERIREYGNCALEVNRIHDAEDDGNLKNLWFSLMHYLKGRQLVNEAITTVPPDKKKLKLAVETFKLAKEKFKPASVCYCVYAVLLELQSIDYLDDGAVIRLNGLLKTAMSSIPAMDETLKPVFLEIESLIEKKNVKNDADLFIKLNSCINKIDHIALREHFSAISEKLISYFKEPFSPEVSYRNWMISIASLDPEKIQGKITIKAGDRVIFEDYLAKRQLILEIPYKPDKKEDTLTFITVNKKSVSRTISFHEKITKDGGSIKVHYMEHDCKRSIYNNHFRVAIVQLKYDLIQDGNVIKIKHDDRYFKKVTSILKAVTGKADLVVFPEFSIPFDYLAELKEHAEKDNIIIVAGSHYVTSDNLNKYQDLFYDEIVESDIRKNISPVIIPGSKILHTEKILGAGVERSSFGEAGMTNGTLNRIFKLCNNVTFGVMVCFDFLNDELRQRISDACNVILVPQTNPGTKRFHKVGKIELENPRSSGNKAYIMASGIFNFNGGKEIMGGDSGLFLTLDKSSQNKNSIIEPVDNVKEQFIQIADLNTDFYAARDIQTAQVAVTTQLIHIFEEHEIRGSGKGNPEAFLKVLDEIELSKGRNEIITLLKDNDAIIKNYSPLLRSNINGNKLDNLRFEEIKDRCRAVVIK